MTRWTVALQVPLSMGFFRQVYWSGLPFPSLGHLPDPGIEPGSPSLQTDCLPSELPDRSRKWHTMVRNTLGVLERNVSSITAPVLAPAAITKHHRLMAYKLQKFISHSSGGWKSEPGYQHSQILVRTLFQVANFLLCPYTEESRKDHGAL